MEDSSTSEDLSPVESGGTEEETDEEYSRHYFTAMGLTLLGNMFVPAWLIGFFEWYMHYDEGEPAYKRYPNPWYGGAMRMNELLAKAFVILLGIIVVIFIAFLLGITL